METKHESAYGEKLFTVTVEPGSGSLSDLMKDIFTATSASGDLPSLSDEPANERIDCIEDVKPGDLLSIGKGLTTVNGIVTSTRQCHEGDGVLHVWFENSFPGYCVGEDEDSWQMRSCYRPLGRTDEDGPRVAEDDEPESKQPAMLRITDIHELRQGDRVHLHKGEVKVEGLYDAIRSGENPDDGGVSIAFTDEPAYFDHYLVKDKWGWTFDYAERRPYDSWTADDLPKERGFYRDATGPIWKRDDNWFAPVKDHDGRPAPVGKKTALVSPNDFYQSSLAAHRFPFVRVSMNVGTYHPEDDE